jgi:hypothetical protein
LTSANPLREETDDPLVADQRNFFKVELWTRDGLHVERLLFAGNSLDKARERFATYGKRRPRARLTIGQRSRLLAERPPAPLSTLHAASLTPAKARLIVCTVDAATPNRAAILRTLSPVVLRAFRASRIRFSRSGATRPAALSVCSTGARHVLLLTVKNLLFPATLGAIVGGIGTSLIETRRAGTDDALPAFFATGGVASELPSVPTQGRRPPANRGGALFCEADGPRGRRHHCRRDRTRTPRN